MKQRSKILVLAAMIPFAVATAQQTPPTPPTPAVAAVPLTPVTPMTPLTPLPAISGQYIDRYQLDEIRRAADEARREGQFAAEEGRRAADEARRALQESRLFDMSDHDFGMAMPQIASNFGSTFSSNFSFATPEALPGRFGKAQWVQGDPADSLYQLGREAMGRYDYSRAASRFAEVIARYPSYRRFSDAVYYQAFSLYRIGTLETLRQGLKVLEANTSRLAYESRNTDAPALQARILRALAQRNEPSADAKLKDLYARYPTATCDTENIGIQSQVLSSLYQSDPDAAMPHIRDALTKRDACSAKLRADAVVLLANRPSEDKAAILISVARNDTAREVRTRAIDFLARMPGDAAINTLMELMRDDDEYVQRAAVRSLMRSDNVKARSALKTAMLEKRDAPESQRLEAIRSFDRDNMTQEDAHYLRGVFMRKDESDRIKEAVLGVLASVPSEENVKFLLDVAKNPNESSTLRARALRTVTRTTLSVDDVIKLYDASDSRPMRQSLVEALSNRREEAALNKLLDIVKYSTDPEVRRYTIQVLLSKNDKTITEKVLNLISKGA